MNVTTDKLVTRTEAAELMGLKPQTLSVWASSGRNDLKFVKIGRCVRYRLSDIEAWLSERTATQTR